MIESIEIVKGATSTLHGAVLLRQELVNIITKKAKESIKFT